MRPSVAPHSFASSCQSAPLYAHTPGGIVGRLPAVISSPWLGAQNSMSPILPRPIGVTVFSPLGSSGGNGCSRRQEAPPACAARSRRAGRRQARAGARASRSWQAVPASVRVYVCAHTPGSCVPRACIPRVGVPDACAPRVGVAERVRSSPVTPLCGGVPASSLRRAGSTHERHRDVFAQDPVTGRVEGQIDRSGQPRHARRRGRCSYGTAST